VFGYGAPLGIGGIVSMVVVFAGCLIMPLKDFRSITPQHYLKNKAMPWIILAALGTTGYTVFDKIGLDLLLRHSGAKNVILGSCAYSTMREIFLFSFLLTIKRFHHIICHIFLAFLFLCSIYAIELSTRAKIM
jgi:hypothetical protein